MDGALEQQWKEVEELIQNKFQQEASMEAILYLVGINEFRGRMPKYKFSKEQKQDLMHVGVCTLLAQYNYYHFTHFDEEGWPHFDKVDHVGVTQLESQELLLKKAIIDYFSEPHSL